MNKIPKTYLFIFILFLYPSICMGAPPVYTDNLINAVLESKKTGCRVLVVFTADWCKYCHYLISDIEKNPNLIEDTIVCYVNYDIHLDLVKTYQVKIIPDYFILKEGTETKRQVGYKGLSHLKEWLSK